MVWNAGASLGGINLQWGASVDGGVVTAESGVVVSDLSVGDGAVTIDRIATVDGKRFRGGVDRTGQPGRWALVHEEMGFGTAGFKADGGEVSLAFRDPDGEHGPSRQTE